MSIEEIIRLLIQYKYFFLFPIVVIEGPIISVVAGFLVALKYFDFYTAYIIVVLGDLAGDVLDYSIGRWGGLKIINKWGRYIGVTAERLKKVEGYFERNTGKTLLLGKALHGVGGVFLYAAGIAKVPILKFVWFNFLGTVPKTLILLSVGFYFGHAISSIKSYLELTGAIFMGVGITVILIWLYLNKYNSVKQP